MDDEMLPSSAHGLIFLFKWTGGGDVEDGRYRMLLGDEMVTEAKGLFFAKQVREEREERQEREEREEREESRASERERVFSFQQSASRALLLAEQEDERESD